jgi:hypothetical protein
VNVVDHDYTLSQISAMNWFERRHSARSGIVWQRRASLQRRIAPSCAFRGE